MCRLYYTPEDKHGTAKWRFGRCFVPFQTGNFQVPAMSFAGVKPQNGYIPSLPNTYSEGVLGIFGVKIYLLTFGVWKPRVNATHFEGKQT